MTKSAADAPSTLQLSLFDGLVQMLPPASDVEPGELVNDRSSPGAKSTAPFAGLASVPGADVRQVDLAGQRVSYRLRRARRKSIGFMVGPEGLSVSAPRWLTLRDVESALAEKASWIVRKLQEVQERVQRQLAHRIHWREGAAIPYLGEDVIVVLDPRISGVSLGAAAVGLPGMVVRSLHVGLAQQASAEQIRDRVQSWLQQQARVLFHERCDLIAPGLGVVFRRMVLSSATTRWGSANANGCIRLNWRLIHFGLPVIDYVVTHELAHLREMNHSQAFWQVVASVMPDYQAPRRLLQEQQLPEID